MWHRHQNLAEKIALTCELGDSQATLLISQGVMATLPSAPPGVSLPSRYQTRNLWIFDPAHKLLCYSGDVYSIFFTKRLQGERDKFCAQASIKLIKVHMECAHSVHKTLYVQTPCAHDYTPTL
jgi:hypothetical protein